MQLPPARDPAIIAVEDWQYELGGLQLKLEVSPCSWMYPGYGFQAEYHTADRRSHGFINNKELPVTLATPDDAIRLLNALVVEPCEVCEAPHIFNPDSNRDHQCEVCFMTKLNIEFEAAQKEDNKAQAKRDAQHKAKGYTHRVIAWVHPSEGGDDYMLEIYHARKPRAEAIKAILKREGSRVFNDYQVIAL